MNSSLSKPFIYIIILLSTFIAHSSDITLKNCQSNFALEKTRSEQLKSIISASIRKATIELNWIEEEIIQTLHAFENFLNFLDPITLEFKNIANEEISKITSPYLKEDFLKIETLESKVLKDVTPQSFINKFVDKQNQEIKNLPRDWINFAENYINHLSFRREVYKFELFMILFGDIFQELSDKHVSALASPRWQDFFKTHATKLFTKKVDKEHSFQTWRHQFQNFITSKKKPTEEPLIVQLGEIKLREEAMDYFMSHRRSAYIHDELKSFFELLHPVTLELKKTTTERIVQSQNMFADERQDVLQREIRESQVFKEVDPQTFEKELRYIHYQYKTIRNKKQSLPDYLTKFFRLYARDLSFRREVYKIELFMKLFKNTFPEFTSNQITQLSSPKWREYFRRYSRELFNNYLEDTEKWRFRLYEYLEHYHEIKPKNIK